MTLTFWPALGISLGLLLICLVIWALLWFSSDIDDKDEPWL